MTPYTPESIDVAHVARLAMLDIPTDDLPRYQADIMAILEYVNQLFAVDMTNIPSARTHAVELDNYRADEFGTCMSQKAALANAPEVMSQEYFKVPMVLNREDGEVF